MSRDVREHPLGAWKGRLKNNLSADQRAAYEVQALCGERVNVGYTPDGLPILDGDGDQCVFKLPALGWLDFLTGEDSTGAWRIEQLFLAQLDDDG